jgi:CHAT domain-containing protein/tetratricopeptide (TPR) repeat protein
MKLFLKVGIVLLAIAFCQPFFAPSQILAEEDPELTEIQQLIHEVDSLARAKQLDTAIVLGKLALRRATKKFGDSDTTVAKVLSVLGVCYYYQANYAQCDSVWNKALVIRERVLGPDHPDVAKSLNNLGNLYKNQGKYMEAEPLYKRAIAIMEKTLGSDHPNLAAYLNNLGTLYKDQGKYIEAEPLYKRAIAIQEKTLGSDHLNLASSLNNLGSLYTHQGKYMEAEPLLKRALAIREKTLGPDHPDLASSLNNLGSLYTHQGKYMEAEPLLKRALVIKEKTLEPDHPDLALSLNNLGSLYKDQGKYMEAEPLYKRAIAIMEKTQRPDHPYVAKFVNSLAVLYRLQGISIKAEPLFRRALALLEKSLGPDHPEVAKCLMNLAILYGSLGEADKSLTYYKKLQQSRVHFIEYVFSYASESQKMRYIEKYPLVDQSLLSFAIMNNSDDSKSCALEMMLKGKAAIIDALLAEKQIAYCSHSDQIRKKTERHKEVCGEISTVTLAGAEKLEPEIYRVRLQTLYSIKDSLETELSNNCAEFKDDLAARRFTMADVANAIPEGSVLWEFVRYEPYDFKKIGNDKERTGSPRYLAFTFDHAGNITLTDLGDAKEIDSLITTAREKIYKAKAEVYSPLVVESERQLNEVTGKLYKFIFAPLASHLGDKTDIFVCPDGQLSLLPFEILPCPDGKYLIEKFKFSYLSSGRDLLRFKKKQIPGDWALVMADPNFDFSQVKLAQIGGMASNKPNLAPYIPEPLRGASGCLNNRFNSLSYGREEAKSVSKTLKDKAKLNVESYLGDDAVEEVLKGMTTAPRVLHLATHGYFCEDIDLNKNTMLENPLLRSGLALAGANRLMDENQRSDSSAEDGILTAFEASGLNLVGTDLVVLSACETGVGEVKNGEGVYGLRRAFQHAGARTIVMSLWKIPDKETCDLMDDFYKSWLGGQTKKEALRQSTLKVLNACRAKYGSAHPLFWGGFVMVGDSN